MPGIAWKAGKPWLLLPAELHEPAPQRVIDRNDSLGRVELSTATGVWAPVDEGVRAVARG